MDDDFANKACYPTKLFTFCAITLALRRHTPLPYRVELRMALLHVIYPQTPTFRTGPISENAHNGQ